MQDIVLRCQGWGDLYYPLWGHVGDMGYGAVELSKLSYDLYVAILVAPRVFRRTSQGPQGL